MIDDYLFSKFYATLFRQKASAYHAWPYRHTLWWHFSIPWWYEIIRALRGEFSASPYASSTKMSHLLLHAFTGVDIFPFCQQARSATAIYIVMIAAFWCKFHYVTACSSKTWFSLFQDKRGYIDDTRSFEVVFYSPPYRAHRARAISPPLPCQLCAKYHAHDTIPDWYMHFGRIMRRHFTTLIALFLLWPKCRMPLQQHVLMRGRIFSVSFDKEDDYYYADATIFEIERWY